MVTWGDPEFGGDSMEVQDRLRNVQGGIKGGSFGDDGEMMMMMMMMMGALFFFFFGRCVFSVFFEKSTLALEP